MKMKWKWKKLTAFIVLPAFFLQGCGVWMVDRGTVYADKPYEIKDTGVQRSTTPYETSEPKLVKVETGQEVVVPAHWEIVDFNGIPPGSYPYPVFDKDPVWRVDKSRLNTFKGVEEYAKKNGYAILKNNVDFPAKMTSGHQPPKIYLIPKGKYIVYKPEEMANGDVVLTPIEVPSCRNQLVWAPKLKWVPRTKVRVDKEFWTTAERYLDKQTIEKRFKDVNTQVDAGAIVGAGILGLVGGLILGHIFWFGSGAASSSTVICPSGVCGPGFPMPRPLP